MAKRKANESTPKVARRNAADELFADITCIVCYENLSGTNPDRYPCNLKCGHSNLCILCAQKLKRRNLIKCPQCATFTTCDSRTSNVPVNVTLKYLLEQYEIKVRSSPIVINSLLSYEALAASVSETMFSIDHVCQNVDDDTEEGCTCNSTLYCQNCELYFCKECGEDRHKTKFWQSHKLIPSKNRTPMCSIHPCSPLNKVCLTDNVLICDFCQLETHNDNHDIHKVEEVADNVRDLIDNQFKDLALIEQGLIMDIIELRQHLHGVAQHATTLPMEVDRIFDLIVKQVETRRLELKNRIQTVTQNEAEESKHLMHDLESCLAMFHKHISTAQDTVANDLDHDFHLLKSTQNIAELLKKPVEDRQKLESFFELLSWKLDQFDETSLKNKIEGLCSLKTGSEFLETENKLRITQRVQLMADNNTINDPLKFNLTPLTDSLSWELDTYKTETLIKFGANLNLPNKNEMLPIFVAIEAEDDKNLELLLTSGVDLNAANQSGNVALCFAATHHNPDRLKRLLAAGADIEIRGEFGTPLNMAVSSNNEDCFKILLDAGANKEAACSNGYTPLLTASFLGYTNILKVLLNNGADKAATTHVGGSNALHLAAFSLSLPCLELLLTAGVNYDAVNVSGDTPLHCAARKGADKLVKMLLNAGANRNIINNNGKTALDLVQPNEQCLTLLRS